MMLRLFFAFLLLPSILFSQKLNKYWVEFTDKNNSPYCTCHPAEFLSQRALERRARAGIEIVENDLPVSAIYIKQLKDNGLQLHGTSRWLNAVAVIAEESALQNKTFALRTKGGIPRAAPQIQKSTQPPS
jgi:serine protease AprX